MGVVTNLWCMGHEGMYYFPVLDPVVAIKALLELVEVETCLPMFRLDAPAIMIQGR